MPDAGWYPDPGGVAAQRYWDGSSWTNRTSGGQDGDSWQTQGSVPSPTRTGRPQARLIRSPYEAEEVAAEWLRWFGFNDAERPPEGADGGVDVRGRSLVAQVKMHMVPVGRPDLQRLHGVAVTETAVSVFFSLTDYTREAREWADQVGMALFRFSVAGEAEPVNSYAASLAQQAEYRMAQGLPPPPPMPGLPINCTDEAASRLLAPKRVGLRGTDQIVWIRQGWIPIGSATYDYTYINTRG